MYVMLAAGIYTLALYHSTFFFLGGTLMCVWWLNTTSIIILVMKDSNSNLLQVHKMHILSIHHLNENEKVALLPLFV